MGCFNNSFLSTKGVHDLKIFLFSKGNVSSYEIRIQYVKSFQENVGDIAHYTKLSQPVPTKEVP